MNEVDGTRCIVAQRKALGRLQAKQTRVCEHCGRPCNTALGREMTRAINFYPKSSKAIISRSTPNASSMFMTALIIIGGPQR